MTKRSGTQGPEEVSSKRHKIHGVDQDAATTRRDPVPVDESTQALLRIAEKADELIACLQGLKNLLPQSRDHQHSHTPQTSTAALSRICKQILPSVQLLGALDESSPAHETERGRHDSKNQTSISDARRDQKSRGSPIPSIGSITPWSSSEIKPGRPELPEILDPHLAEEAFTHPGLGLRFSYERLEWLGDAYLELISTALIHETFGQLPSGRCSQLRERLIRNVTLAEYFRHYNMQQWARLPGDFSDGRGLGRGKSCDKDLLKTQADMFEAYVAAVVLSDPQHGLARAIGWLKALWGKTIEEDIRKAENLGRTTTTTTTTTTAPAQAQASASGSASAALDGGRTSSAPASSAKEQLAQRIVVKGILLRYRDLPCEKRDKNLNLPLYSIGLYLDGWGEQDRLLAVGTALNKKEAGQKAAEVMLQNRKLMKTYEEKKRAYMQAREAEAARQ